LGRYVVDALNLVPFGTQYLITVMILFWPELFLFQNMLTTMTTLNDVMWTSKKYHSC